LNKQSAIESVYILGNGYHCDITVFYITSLLWCYVVRKYILYRFFLSIDIFFEYYVENNRITGYTAMK